MLHYKGNLGEFSFDPKMFELQDDYLHYIGGTSRGCIKCKIPEGIKICDFMFAGNKQLKVGPELPKSCISANSMFKDCTNLIVFPEINAALMNSNDFDSRTMLAGCVKLEKLCVTIDGCKRIDPYVCACEWSLDYKEHLAAMQDLIAAENDRKIEDWKITHWLQMKFHPKDDLEIRKQVPQFTTSGYHQIEFSQHEDLVTILKERQKGNYIGIETKRKGSDTSDKTEVERDALPLSDSADSNTDDPKKIKIE